MKRLNKLKTLATKAFETFGGGALRQLSSWEAKQLGYLRKEELCHVEGETRNISKTLDFIDIEILACIVGEATSLTRQDARRVRSAQNDCIRHPELVSGSRNYIKSTPSRICNAHQYLLTNSTLPRGEMENNVKHLLTH